MNLITTVEPVVEPVSLQDIYTFLRLDPSGLPATHPDDAMLRTMIRDARIRAEQVTRRAFVQQTIRLITDGFPCRRFGAAGPWGDGEDWIERDGWLELPRPPFVEVVAVRYYDAENVLQTLAPSAYFVTEQSFVPRLMVADGGSWPDTYTRDDALQVDYVVGYPADGSPPADFVANVPAQYKNAIMIGVQLLYDELALEKRDQLEAAFQRQLAGNRVHRF